MEVWKSIEGYEGLYEVSDLGNVKSFAKYKEGLILKPKFRKDGYLQSNLWKDKKYKSFLIHSLVAKTFLENLDNKPCVNHINNQRSDNRLINLEFVTHSENNFHATKQGRMSTGEKNGMNKLTWNDINEIRKSILPTNELALIYKVHKVSITRILTNKTWVQ